MPPKRGSSNVKRKGKASTDPVVVEPLPLPEGPGITSLVETFPSVEVEAHEELKVPEKVSDKSNDSLDDGKMTTEEKFKYYDTFTEDDFNELSPMFPLRGYCSEVNLPTALAERIPELKSGPLLKTRCQSMENLILSGNSWDSIDTDAQKNTDESTRHCVEVTSEMMDEWTQLFDETSQTRFSFFDELFARGHIVDSLEVPSHPENLEYLIEAEPSDYQDKVDFGRVVLKTKHVYTGNFKNWYFDGFGQYKWRNGCTYKGDFKNGVMHGEGVLEWKDGSIYEGQFLDGVRAGWGVYSTASGYTYAGDWYHGLPHGKGKIWYDPKIDDGDYYDGNWYAGKTHGHGLRQYANGDRYVGNWEFGIRSGVGTMTWLNERQVYNGNWSNGIPHGKGRHTWYMTRTEESNFTSRHVYEGDFLEGLRHGIGRMTYSCGSVYEGRWYEGNRYGKGIFINPAGHKIVGLFRLGSIISGTEVQLHSSSYRCDFVPLMGILYKRFGGRHGEKSDELEQENISNLITTYNNICQFKFKFTLECRDMHYTFLDKFREFYKRAGYLGETWGAYGVVPSWKKKSNKAPRITLQDGKRRIDREAGHGDGCGNPCCLPKDVKVIKKSPDNVHPVTRFGFWLLMRDCPRILEDITTSEIDNIFSTIEPLAFQTAYNPFEPIYLWQFLQCLVTIAGILYLEIPARSELLPERPESPAFDDDDELIKDFKVGGSKDEQLPSSSSAEPEIVAELSKKPSPIGQSASKTEVKDLEEPLKPVSSVSQEEAEVSKNPNEVCVNSLPSSPPRTDSITPSADISEAFGKLLTEIVIPYLETDPGTNLPPIPNPLPSLTDLHSSFRTIHKDRFVITGFEFFESVLPEKSRPEYQDPIYWNRSKQVLNPFSDIKSLVQNSIANKPDTATTKLTAISTAPTASETEFIGEKTSLQNMLGGSLHLKCKKRPSVEIYGSGNKVFGINPSDTESEGEETAMENDLEYQENPFDPDCDLLDSTVFDDRDLASEPFLWEEEAECSSSTIQINNRAFENLTADDVLNVLRYLYPKVCGESCNTDLGFEMNFGDWMFGMSMIAKISAEREFYNIMKKESMLEHKPRTRGVASTPKKKFYRGVDVDPCDEVKRNNSSDSQKSSRSNKG